MMIHPSRRFLWWLSALILLCLPVQSPFGQSERLTTLHVTVLDFANTSGTAGVAVWNMGRGFPEEIELAVATTYADITDGRAVAEFDSLVPGIYAVTVFHDENCNCRFDKNWLGVPREAWGVSNNVRPWARAPRFDEARFNVAAGLHDITIHLKR